MIMDHCLLIGRFQPLCKGHIGIARQLLDEGNAVVFGIMDTPRDERNPYSLTERRNMIATAFPKDWPSRVKIVELPYLRQVVHGRNTGYWVRQIFLPEEEEGVSASQVRGQAEAPSMLNVPEFVAAWDKVASEIHRISCSQDLWQDGPFRSYDNCIAWAHSELSEVRECLRDGNPPDKNISDMSGAEVQLADVLGILMDMSQGYGFKIAEALLRKIMFNATRPKMHGRDF
jgi:nicotinamide mononucleotide adenylyltransferase